jgi:hypothetical protein
MNMKRFNLLFLIFISLSGITISTAQTDTIAQPIIPFIKLKDTAKANSLKQIELSVEVTDTIPKEPFVFVIEQSIISTTLWQQPYRFEDKSLKTLIVKIVIKRNTAKIESLDFNLFSLIDEPKKLRIRSSGVYYPKRDKKKYLKYKPVNENYNDFKDLTINGFQNFEAETYKTNFLGLRKKNISSTVNLLKKLTIKARKVTYYLDFPVQEGFTYGKIYYKDKPVGFAAVK